VGNDVIHDFGDSRNSFFEAFDAERVLLEEGLSSRLPFPIVSSRCRGTPLLIVFPLLLDPVPFASAVAGINERCASRVTAGMFRSACHFLRDHFAGPVHPAGIAAVPPHDAAYVDIACASFRPDGLDKRPHASLLGRRQEVQLTVDENCLLASHVSFRPADRRIFRAARLRVRYSDF
jgi:hypothetical protein